MNTFQRERALKAWSQWWQETKEEWFKVEVLQDYSGEDRGPSLAAWLAGNREQSMPLMMKEYSTSEWVKMCRQSPARKRRFHVVQEPYSPYLEWEIELYRRINIPLAREEIFLVSQDKINHLSLPDGDIAIFDCKRVTRNHYSKDGRLEHIDFYDARADDISQFLHLRDQLPSFADSIH